MVALFKPLVLRSIMLQKLTYTRVNKKSLTFTEPKTIPFFITFFPGVEIKLWPIVGGVILG